MRRDYRLYELNDDEFETLVVRICARWFGVGVTPFAPGPDGGRDGKFNGTAESFPSTRSPLQGAVVLQAKHVSAPDKSCSETDFRRLLKKESPKIEKLVADGICEHYIVFTNRKLTGGADAAIIEDLLGLGLTSAHVIGTERLHLALDDYADIRESLPNNRDAVPFRFDPQDLVEVIGAFHEFAQSSPQRSFDSAHDFDSVRIRDEKNKINGLSARYYSELLVNGSMPHFAKVEDFLKNPRNRAYADFYHDAADELKAKILSARDEFTSFDDVFAFLYEQIQQTRNALRGKRRLISVLLHYMYFNCDIGDKAVSPNSEPSHVDS